MGGGLMQLVAYGAQDVYLTGEPQITFFKVVYRRHTNFAIESIKQTFNGQAGFGGEVSATIARNGDLVTGMHLEITPTLASANDILTDAFGHYIVDEATLSIGGQKIDKHYGMWLELWDELTGTSEKKAGYDAMVGKESGWKAAYHGSANGLSGEQVAQTGNGSTTPVFYVPLQFWFNRNPGLALPLIALQYHEVKLDIKFSADVGSVVTLDLSGSVGPTKGSPPTGLKCELYVDYIYLDTEERRRFAQMSHEYLIDQLQYQVESVSVGAGASAKPRLTFNHPVKELVWATVEGASVTAGDNFNFGTGLSDAEQATGPVASAVLQLNGHDRFSRRNGDYFRYVQPYYHHTRIPTKPVYSYSFALRPEEHQPSGTCNFSRIDNAILDVAYTAAAAGKLHIFAVNYNVLRVVSGMGGLAYSN
jgi:hypothetical protein